MFIHGKTNEKYYSVREKKNYYKKRINDKSLSEKQRKYALTRFEELVELDKRDFVKPTVIVTNDKHFNNEISKPRVVVAYGKDEKNRLIVYPIHKREIKTIIPDNDYSRQIEGKPAKIADSEVYELKYVDTFKPLTENDLKKFEAIHKKNADTY